VISSPPIAQKAGGLGVHFPKPLEALSIAELVLPKAVLVQPFTNEGGAAVIARHRFTAMTVSDAGRPHSFSAFAGHAPEVIHAVWLNHALVVQRMVLAARHYLKIFYSVVISNAVDVMHDLVPLDWTPKVAAHYKDVFANVTTLVRVWAIKTNEHVAFSACVAPALVAWIQRPLPSVWILGASGGPRLNGALSRAKVSQVGEAVRVFPDTVSGRFHCAFIIHRNSFQTPFRGDE
jgi:hypothetical protein